MTKTWVPIGASLFLLMLGNGPLRADPREIRTVEASADVLHALSDIPMRCIPYSLMREARGVAIFPGVVKAGFLIDGRFGRGVVLARQPDGSWGNPVFITLHGGGVGVQAGIESTDVVLVFRTAQSLDRFLKGKGKLTLGADISIAAGPLGREAQAATDARLQAEIFSYSRSRGLFAGASLEGAALLADRKATESFYSPHPAAVAAHENAALDRLKSWLVRLSTPPGPQPTVVLIPSTPPPTPQPIGPAHFPWRQ
jgi:lipid-binding SYLF domain-containing protein